MDLLQTRSIVFIVLISLITCQETPRNDVQPLEKRTLDLLGIDLAQIFDRLISPSGIVNQFAVSVSLQLFQTVGYLISGVLKYKLCAVFNPVFLGILYQVLAATTTGTLREAITFFDFLMSPQVNTFCLKQI